MPIKNLGTLTRDVADTAPIFILWPTLGATIVGKKGDGTVLAGAITFSETIEGEHWYEIAYDSADRPSAPGSDVYTFDDGTDTAKFILIAEGAPASAGVNGLSRGGDVHTRMILEACLVSADRAKGIKGIHEDLFMEALIASVGHDRMLASPSTLGLNQDRSPLGPEGYWQTTNIVTRNGVEV